MKQLSTMKFVTEATETFVDYKNSIKTAETYEQAKIIGYQALGYINCMITFLNSMVCEENNDFTVDLDEVLDSWQVSVYQALVDAAIRTEQDKNIIWNLLKKRDAICG